MTRFLFAMIAAAGLATAQDKPSPRLISQNAYANVELTVYIVSGYAQAQPAGKDEVPPDLSATLQQLRGIFTYKSYKLIEAITLRGRNWSGSEVAGDLTDYGHYDFKYNRATITAETPHTVRLDGLRLEITRRSRQQEAPAVVALVSTDIDIKEGQRTVVGKSAVNFSDALFLVIVPKVIE
jgi:hypothetical protein